MSLYWMLQNVLVCVCVCVCVSVQLSSKQFLKFNRLINILVTLKNNGAI